MNRHVWVLFLAMILILAVPMGMIVQSAQSASVHTGPKQVSTSHMVALHPGSEVKISPEQAVNIALNVHKHSKMLSVKLERYLYVVHLKTPLGKRTLKVGANTGKILYDKLDWVSKMK